MDDDDDDVQPISFGDKSSNSSFSCIVVAPPPPASPLRPIKPSISMSRAIKSDFASTIIPPLPGWSTADSCVVVFVVVHDVDDNING